jgi:hypothetical protein
MPMRPWSMFVDWLHGISARSAPAAPRQQPHERPPDVEPPREVDLLRAAERDAIVATHLNGRLQALGFVQVAPRRWSTARLHRFGAYSRCSCSRALQ